MTFLMSQLNANSRILLLPVAKETDRYDIFRFSLFQSFHSNSPDSICMCSCQKNTKVIFLVNLQQARLNPTIFSFRSHIEEKRKKK